jgi:hypothetical protein
LKAKVQAAALPVAMVIPRLQVKVTRRLPVMGLGFSRQESPPNIMNG